MPKGDCLQMKEARKQTKKEDKNTIKREVKMIREKVVEIEDWQIRSNICIIGISEAENNFLEIKDINNRYK